MGASASVCGIDNERIAERRLREIMANKTNRPMEKQTVENKVRRSPRRWALTYLCESWFRANQAFDRFRRQGESREVTHPDGLTLPACLYVQPVAGFLNFTSQGFVRDAPSCLISFADAMPLDYKGADAEIRRAAERSCRAIHRRRKRKRLFSFRSPGKSITASRSTRWTQTYVS